MVWDNLNTHFDGKDQWWTRFNQRHQQRFHFVYTPKPDLRAAVLGLIRFWNVAPRPFRWTFTGDFAQPSLKQAA